MRRIGFAILGLSILACCPEPQPDPMPGPVLEKRIPVNLNRNLDIVFLVDNSGSMLAEQQQLTANFPEFIGVLQQIEGGLPDVHLGVLSSNVGAAGAPSVPGCPAAGDNGNLLTGPPGNTCATQYGLQGSFISDIAQPNGTRLTNYQEGKLAQLFTCMASLGTSGCGFEMHLESMYRALQPGKNPGFYRPEAYLAVVFLADEDDCSTEMGTMFGDANAGLMSALGPRTSFRCHEFGVQCDNDPNPRAFGPKTGCRPRDNSMYMYEVERYIDFLRGLKADPSLVIVAGIIGDFDAATGALTVGPDPNNAMFPSVQKSCFTRDPNDPDDGAAPPVRMHRFLSSFPGRNTVTTICNENLQDAMAQIAELLKTAIGNPCIERALADRNPNLDGLQPECSVVDVINPNSETPEEHIIPPCSTVIQAGTACDPGSAGMPCWCIHPNAPQCPKAPQNFAIDVNRGGATPPLGTVLEVQCVTATP